MEDRVEFQVWVLGYDKDHKATDFEDLELMSLTTAKANEKYKELVEDLTTNGRNAKLSTSNSLDNVKFVCVRIEKVEVSSDYSEAKDLIAEQEIELK